ncbi:MAG: ChaN family lipoprotein [Burkholderiaceae bacterium]|nr:ChaN family lipoprotein [Burkholderiaceae bacterium]
MPTNRRRWLLAAAAAGLGGCASSAHRHEAASLIGGQPGVLLGEVHDNADGHALRLAAVDAWLARGARPAIVLEMFDRGDQAAIDRLQAARAAPDGRAFVDAVLAARPAGASRGGWDWRFYRPFIDRALHLGLPLVAANVGRAEGRALMRDGLAVHGFEADVPPDVLAAHTHSIEASHCGHVGADLAARMALIQVARDQQMARAVEAHIDRGVLLLAGNGHVRTDVGVPRWLSPAARARCQAIGVLEAGDTTTAYDRIVHVPAARRADPCASMRPPQRSG